MSDTETTEVSARFFVQRSRMQRLEQFIDVTYALLFVNFIMYLPNTENMAWTDKEFGLFSLLADDPQQMLRLFIAVGLTLINWNLTHKLLGPVEQSDGLHTLLTLLQLVLVCFFLYFAIADPDLVSVSSKVGQSISLALSGFTGIAAWIYARRKDFANLAMSEAEKDQVLRSVTIEPITAVLTIGLAFISSAVWSLSWLVIPAILAALQDRLLRD